MDIFQNQCSESLGFDSMLAANPINSPLQSTDSPTHLNFSSTSYFTSIPPQSNPVATNTNGSSLPPICNLTSNNCLSSGPNDVLLPSIFVKVPMQINQQYQQQNQSRSNPAEIKCEDKSEPIKRELGDLRALEKGTAMVQLPSIAECYLVEDRQERQEDELVVHCCECCPFITIVEQSLREHIHAKHKSEGDKTSETLNCPACANKFRQRNSLEVHLLEDHMMVQSEMQVLMEHRFPSSEQNEAVTNCNSVPQEHVLASDTLPVVTPEQNKSRIYIKNVQLLKKPDVIEKENVQHAQQQHAEQQQQQQHQNGKIFIRNVSLLQNANFAQNVDNVFRNASGLHESKYSFVVPTPSPNSQSPPISISEPISSTSQRSKIFIRNVDILRNPLLPITPSSISSTCDMSRTSSSESLYTTPPPPVVSPATSVISIGGSSMGSSGLNMVILPTSICSSNSSTPPTTATSPVITVTSSESIHSQPPTRKSKIFIKNISVLKQPTIHLKSVDELNLMTIDQLQYQNLLPAPNTTQNMENCDMPVNGEHQSMEEDFGNILNDSVADLEDFNGTEAQYQELQVCDSACGSVSEQETYQSEFNSDFIIIEPSSSAENVTYDGSTEPLRIAAPSTELIDQQMQQQQQQALPEPPDPPDSQQYHQTDEDILFVCAEEIINLDPPVPRDKTTTEQANLHTVPPVLSQAPSTQQQQQSRRIYVSGNLMEHHSPPAPNTHIPPHPSSFSTPIEPLNKVEQIEMDVATECSSNSELPQTTTPIQSAEKDRARSRGRPKGAKQTGITKLKKLYTNLTPLEEGYKCDLVDCGARFKQPETLMYHKKCHIPPTEGASPDAIRCPECGSQEFRSWNTLHTHLWREHSVDMELYSCHLCNFKTPVLCRLNNTHMKIHSDEKNFICAICDKAFKNNKQLRNHRRSHRDQPQGQQVRDKQSLDRLGEHPKQHSPLPVNCVKCGLKFSNQKALKTHVESRHIGDGDAGEGRMRCSICGMVFKTRYLLQSHVAKHSDEKKFKCDHCDYSTNDHNAIRRHKMRHNSGGHMYSCSYCDYTSIQSTTYRKHLERLHADVASNLLYKCSKCTFVSISGLKYQLHRAKHDSSEDTTAENECQTAVDPPPSDQPADEEPERLCESVNSDVVIVDKDPAEPPLDAFSLIPPTTYDHQFPLQPMIRPAGFANNLSKVDNFYGYSNSSLENATIHYQQQAGGQQVSSQNDIQLMPKDGESSVSAANSSGAGAPHQHEYFSNSVLHGMATMAPIVGCGDSTHGN